MTYRALFLTKKFVGFVQNRFVSTVNVNVNAFRSIEIKAKDVHAKSDDFVKLTFFDGQKKEVDASAINSLSVISTVDEFKMECKEPNELAVVIEIPLANSSDAKIDITAGSSNVNIANLLTKSISVNMDSGDLSLSSLQGTELKAEMNKGSITTLGKILVMECLLTSKSGVSTSDKIAFKSH
jgi:DUF4097 and DUF4098 domain-containing protein YvlB